MIERLVQFAILLIGALGQRVGRQQIALLPFFLGQHGMIAIDRRAGRIDKFFDAVLPSRLHHIQRSHNIVLLIKKRHLNTARHRAPRRLMHHIMDTLARFHAGVQILDIPFDKRIVWPVHEHFDILLPARGEIVKRPHLIA